MSTTVTADTKDAAQAAEDALLARIQAGELIEDMDDLTPRYRAILGRTLEIAAQSEVTVLTWAYTGYAIAPDIGAKVAICEEDRAGARRPENRKNWSRTTRYGRHAGRGTQPVPGEITRPATPRARPPRRVLATRPGNRIQRRDTTGRQRFGWWSAGSAPVSTGVSVASGASGTAGASSLR